MSDVGNVGAPKQPERNEVKAQQTTQSSIGIVKDHHNNELVILLKKPGSYCFNKTSGDFLYKPDAESEPRRMSPDEIKDFIKSVRTDPEYGEPLAQEMERSFEKNYTGRSVIIKVLKTGEKLYENTKKHTQRFLPETFHTPYPKIYMPQEIDENGNGKNYRWETDWALIDKEQQTLLRQKHK